MLAHKTKKQIGAQGENADMNLTLGFLTKFFQVLGCQFDQKNRMKMLIGNACILGALIWRIFHKFGVILRVNMPSFG